MNIATNTPNVNGCKYPRLQAALRMPAHNIRPYQAPAGNIKVTSGGVGLLTKATSLMVAAFAFYVFASAALVDSSAWETKADQSVAQTQQLAGSSFSVVPRS